MIRGEGYRDKTLDILKGLGIILVVWGHCGAPGNNFVYLFHMAIFFMASGYMWDDKNAGSVCSCVRYIGRKIKGLWLPYFIANGWFTICNNLFLKIGIYTDDADFLLLNIGEYDALTQSMSLTETLKVLCKNFLFAGSGSLGGATWFLRTLFFVSIGNVVLRFIRLHWRAGKLEIGKWLFWAAVVLTIVITQAVVMLDWSLPGMLHNCFAAYLTFLMGMAIRRWNLMDRWNKAGRWRILIWMITLAVLLLLNQSGRIGMDSGDVINVVVFAAASAAGWIFLYGIAGLLKGRPADAASYIGRKSIWILALHFLSFKLVSWLYVAVTGASALSIAMHPVVHDAGGLWWMAYLAAGISLPLLCAVGWQKVKSFVRTFQ